METLVIEHTQNKIYIKLKSKIQIFTYIQWSLHASCENKMEREKLTKLQLRIYVMS